MNREEVATLLGLMAARDGRTVGRVEVEAWLEDVGEWDFATARQAVSQHYRSSREFLRPHDLIQAIRTIRAERLEGAGQILPEADPDDVRAYLAEIRAINARVAAGEITPPRPSDADQTAIDPRIRAAIEDGLRAQRDRRIAAERAAAEAEQAERDRQMAALAEMPVAP